jgi:thiazole synthase
MDDPLIIAGKSLKSRFLLGTGKFKNKSELTETILKSGAEIVTVALRRIDLERHADNILAFIPENITLMTNTSGARNAAEAIRIAQIARAAGYGNWIKIEVINDSKYLLPDNAETIKAVEKLASDGFIVLPYMNPDLYTARDLVKAGAAAVMPLGSLIGSNQGLKTKTMLEILIEEIDEVPIIVDAGIGRPSQAAQALEMGVAAVLVNTAVATADQPVLMAQAFSKSIEAGRMAYLAKLASASDLASASSPLSGALFE